MTFIEKVREQHDWLKNHKFRDGKSVYFTDEATIREYVRVFYDFIGNYYRLTAIKNDLEFYDRGIYKAEDHLTKEEKDANSLKMGYTKDFVHDARTALIHLRYYRDHKDFGLFAERLIGMLDCYLMQVHEFLDHGQVTFGYYVDQKGSTFSLYIFDVVGKKSLSDMVEDARIVQTLTLLPDKE
jgi:hypothetical protein